MDLEQQAQAFEDYSFAMVDKLFNHYQGKLAEMPNVEQDVVLIWRVEADMYNGGFMQYFCNWGYENYLATLKVLEKIGALHAHAILVECEQIIAPISHDTRVKSYQDLYHYYNEYVSAEKNQRLQALEESYWESPDQLMNLAFNYYLQPS